jgi:hypothetical protein
MIRIPRSEITFSGDHFKKTIVVDEKGFYQAELPVGFYKMTARGPIVGAIGLNPYTRSFQVEAPANLVINASLGLERTTCDAVAYGDTPQQLIESRKDACGGDDIVPMPARDGTPFELLIRYPARQLERYGFLYEGNERNPIEVSYNLLFLRADQVIYVAKQHEIVASGHVAIEDSSGKTQHSKNVHLMFQDGVAAQFREQLPRALQYDQQH